MMSMDWEIDETIKKAEDGFFSVLEGKRRHVALRRTKKAGEIKDEEIEEELAQFRAAAAASADKLDGLINRIKDSTQK